MDKKQKLILISGIAIVGVISYFIVKNLRICKIKAKGKWSNDVSFDTENVNKVCMLHPNYRKRFVDFLDNIEEATGLIPKITSTYRSIEEQRKLKLENPKNADAGKSRHNYGLAIDINMYDPRTKRYVLKKANTNADWKKVADIGKQMGFYWGGDFTSYHDPVHFELRPDGLSTTQLLAMYDEGKVDKNGYVKI